MPQIPDPRSYQQILADIVNAFESNFGIPQLIVGSPLLRIFEAAAQSDFRSSNDIFALLRAQNLNQASGPALLLIAADENITPIAESAASGPVTITDTSFTKISTRIFQGQAAPIVGSTIIYVQDASLFPSMGSLYIGRGTIDYEGPLVFTATANLGTFWSITLSTPTQKFHNLGESVILAQGGDRVVSAGTQVQTAQGNAQSAVQFITLYNTVIPDGETTIDSVQVIALRPGLVGNVAAGAINTFSVLPFAGATVSNPTPFTNANATESEEALRERIRNTRQSRSRGTPLAITTGVIGATATDENKRVVSAAVVTRANYPTTLYIDDGTGYEEVDQGIAFETLVSSAIGGEQYFTVTATPPVAKAFVTSGIVSPFTLEDGCELAVIISGLTYIHTFTAAEFKSITSASAFEITASINGDFNFPVSARTAASGTKVVLFAKQDQDETIQVTTPPAESVDANQFLNFPTTPVQTMALYKNDRLLSKDGRAAILTSNVQAGWSHFSGSQQLIIDVDGTGDATYTFTDADFVNAATGYTTLQYSNSLASWAAVFNAKIVGVTTTVANGGLTLKSNLGNQSRASLSIKACDFVTDGVFSIPSSETALTATGLDNDYSLDRNRGEIFLETPLSAGDTLSIGTVDTRAFIQSNPISTITIPTGAELWFAIDGDAQIVPTGIITTSQVTLAAFVLTPPDATHVRVRITATPTITGGVFANVQPGDWIILLDPIFNTTNQGAWRVSLVDSVGHAYVEICRPALFNPEVVTLTIGGLIIVRSTAYLQRILIPPGTNYTATSLATQLAGQIDGADVETFKTINLRIRTNTENLNGDVALVAANEDGQLVGLPISSAVFGTTPDAGFAESGNPDYGTPAFTNSQVNAPSSATQYTVASASAISLTSGNQVVFLRDLPDSNSGAPYSRVGSNLGYHSAVDSIVTNTTINTRLPVLEEFINKGRFYVAAPYATGPADSITILVDGDVASKRYPINVYRRVIPTTPTYGISNKFLDVDNSSQVLTAAFGQTFQFADFALYMHARTKSHAVGGDTTKTILWRWYKHGPIGNGQIVKYVYPTTASAGITVVTDNLSALASVAQVGLASGAARTGITVRSTTNVGAIVATSGPNQLITYFLGLSIASASRTTNVTTITTDFTGTTATDHGLQTSNVVFIKSTNPSFASGTYTITRINATQFSYAESGANVGPTAGIGTVSYDSAGEATFTGSTVVVGDIIYVNDGNNVMSPLEMPGKISALAAQFWKTTLPTSLGTSTVISWGPLNSPNNLVAYPLNATSNAADMIATSVNALAAATNSTCTLTAVAVGNGVSNTGVVSSATYEDTDPSSNAAGYTLTDGVQYIRSETQPVSPSDNYTLVFKDSIAASLATNSDWQNEDCRLVPKTILNNVDWFNVAGVSGLFSTSEITASSRGAKLQLITDTPGSTGSVQVQGGLANAATASVTSSSSNTTDNTAQVVTVHTADVDGFLGGDWFELTNAAHITKPVFTASSSVQSIDTDSNSVATPNVADQGLLTMAVGNLWTNPIATASDIYFQFEHQGKYTVIDYADVTGGTPFAGLSEGDWVVVGEGVTSPVTSNRNLGTFKVVRTNSTQVWIENPNSVEELSYATIIFVSGNSVMPGDTFTLSSTAFGTDNAGTYTVVASYQATINGVGYSTSNQQIVVSPAFASSYTGPTVLGSNFTLFQITDGTLIKLTKKLATLNPNQFDGSLTDLKFVGTSGSTQISPVAGTVVSALDKYAFASALSRGVDAYAHAVGLIGTVNQIAYGDETNPTQFPGIIAAGADVNIQGPLVRRVQTAFAIRVRSGVATSDIIDSVKTAVAEVINSSGIGIPIAISDLVAAAQSVNGVVAVSVISPTYNTGNDLIDVQPFEKALVLNIDTDITVTLIGV